LQGENLKGIFRMDKVKSAYFAGKDLFTLCLIYFFVTIEI
jgi:hypothetical protein